MRITAKQLAEKAGVSQATVSLVLRGNPASAKRSAARSSLSPKRWAWSRAPAPLLPAAANSSSSSISGTAR